MITLEVTPEEGEKLALAATEGKLQLALRNYTDTANSDTRGTTIPGLLSRTEAPKAVGEKGRGRAQARAGAGLSPSRRSGGARSRKRILKRGNEKP